MAGFLTVSTVIVRHTGAAIQIVPQLQRGAYAAIKNVGGLDVGGVLPGPDDVWILVGVTTNVPDLNAAVPSSQNVYPNAFFLLVGDSITLPADLETIYATSAARTTTLSIATGVRTPR